MSAFEEKADVLPAPHDFLKQHFPQDKAPGNNEPQERKKSSWVTEQMICMPSSHQIQIPPPPGETK